KTILSYDDVLREQREIIYKQRDEIIAAEDSIRTIIEEMIHSTVTRLVHNHTQDEDDTEWNLEAIVHYAHANLLNEEDISVADLEGKDLEEMIAFMMEKVRHHYDEKEQELLEEQMHEFEKVILLRTVDSKWMDHKIGRASCREREEANGVDEVSREK